jgi:transcriptional regulator with XRE-family HTH domain
MPVVKIRVHIMPSVNLSDFPYRLSLTGKGECFLSCEIDYTALGARIREVRERTNLTQERLAEICSLSTAHIGHVERGTRKPSLEAVFKIAVTLHTSIDVLLFDSYGGDDKTLCDMSAIIKSRNTMSLKALVANTRVMLDEIDCKL